MSARDLSKGLSYLQAANEIENIESKSDTTEQLRRLGRFFVDRAYRYDFPNAQNKWYWGLYVGMIAAMIGTSMGLAISCLQSGRYESMILCSFTYCLFIAILISIVRWISTSHQFEFTMKGARQGMPANYWHGLSVRDAVLTTLVCGLPSAVIAYFSVMFAYVIPTIIVLAHNIWVLRIDDNRKAR
jgi:hypothetical protein